MLRTLVVSAASGLTKPPAVRQQYYQERYKYLQKFRPQFEQMLAEQYFIDDASRVPIETYMQFLVTRCETLIGMEDKTVCGIAIFCPVIRGRKAEFTGWVNPDYRKGYIQQKKMLTFLREDAYTYAFHRMELIKVETRIASENKSAIKFALNIAFQPVGWCHLDFQVSGKLFDSLLLEWVNPACTIEPVEEIVHGESTRPARELSDTSNGTERPSGIQSEPTDSDAEFDSESEFDNESSSIRGQLLADIFAT